MAEDSAVSRFVDTIHKAVRNVSFKYIYILKLYKSDHDFLPTSTTSA